MLLVHEEMLVRNRKNNMERGKNFSGQLYYYFYNNNSHRCPSDSSS